ncbi:coiled-coil domain-containing protein 160 homolog [Salminus brasiliensis]|uniref:coiled-coil domain-containing protein 160 homolog n=1 Tax=Salminus brasiliensis TaxID=930266 RepID=UPI003B833041
MEITEGSVKQSEELHHHWVEKLFPPRFTFQDLFEGKCHSTEEPRISPALRSDKPDLRRQIYVDVLRQVQEKEEKTRRSNLTKRISRGEQSVGDVQNQDSCEKKLTPGGPMGDSEGETCIWNEGDISKLRADLTELQRDRWRLRERLRSSEERLKSEGEERKRLRELLEEREEQLGCSRKETMRHALVVKSLKMEVHQKDMQLQKFNMQRQEKAEEAEALRAELRRARDGCRQIKQECSDLAWELERVNEQQKMEGARQAEEARLEHQAAVVRLQKELEEARAELRTERESHSQTLTALDLLRRHFSNQ